MAVIPRATYRVQLHRDFRFADAHRAGALSRGARRQPPLLLAVPARAPGSTHGYDIVDHNQLNPEIGTREDFDALVATLHEHGMGMLSTSCPTTWACSGGDNAWWMDVLENGRASSFAEFFDIDWNVADPVLTQSVLLPVLGDQYGLILERGELQLGFEADTGCFTLRYYEHTLPIDPTSYPSCWNVRCRLSLRRTRYGNHRCGGEPAGLVPSAAAARHLDAAQRAERDRDKDVHKRTLARLARAQPALRNRDRSRRSPP